jgi:hypothetical protein
MHFAFGPDQSPGHDHICSEQAVAWITGSRLLLVGLQTEFTQRMSIANGIESPAIRGHVPQSGQTSLDEESPRESIRPDLNQTTRQHHLNGLWQFPLARLWPHAPDSQHEPLCD